MMTDPMADMLTRIRNAVRIERPLVEMSASRMKVGVAEVLKAEGYILEYQVGKTVKDKDGAASFETISDWKTPNLTLRVYLKYGPQGEKVIQHLERVSRPGCRIYRSYGELKPVLDGLGIAVISTSKGVLSDRQARTKRLGGEVLCKVW
jgi:small subunit ribosomal protein S8